ncbi:MAG TPA: DUF480 domain-containing protein [bacterium]|nr:DUF480 domain-containing protein [bacterium]
MIELDRTEARIVGVLIEKQRTVPDSYPMTENALVSGCNQKSNRDPEMSLQAFEVAGACMALQQREVIARVEGGGRAVKYRHRLDERLDLGDDELAVLCELLVRGPQAPGALKPRVQRLGFHASPAQIEAVLRGLAARQPALVAQLPKRARERDHRWAHRLGPNSGVAGGEDTAGEDAVAEMHADASASASLLERLAALEARVEALERRLD